MSGRPISSISFIAVLAIVLSARIFGPGDLYDKDQPKTMAATVDIALNGHWIWPSDALLDPATKPPLYNWLDAIVLKLSPHWDEWTFKLPSIFATVVVAWIVVLATRWMLPDDPHISVIAFLAAAIWIANPPVMKQMYLSRPDMLLTAFLAGAWLLAMRAIDPTEPRSRRFAFGFWLCVAGAILSKGPAALLPIVHALLAAKLIHKKWGASKPLFTSWALPLAVVILVACAFAAYRARPDDFFAMIRSEAGSRFTSGAPELLVTSKPVYLPALWFIKNFFPWSVAAAASLLLTRPKRIFQHPLAPALLWVALLLVAFSAIPGKRADYLLPAYPAASILAAYAIVHIAARFRIPAAACAAIPVLMACYLAHWEWTRSPEAKSGDTRALLAFARDVRKTVPQRDPLIVLVKGYHPLLCLLGRFEGNQAQQSDLRAGTWVVSQENDAWPAHAKSAKLRDVIETGPKQITPGRIALYRIGDVGVTTDALAPVLAEQYRWNFPPDRYRGSRGESSAPSSGF